MKLKSIKPGNWYMYILQDDPYSQISVLLFNTLYYHASDFKVAIYSYAH